MTNSHNLYKYDLKNYWDMFEQNGWSKNDASQMRWEDDVCEFEMTILASDYHDVRVAYVKNTCLSGDIGIGWIEVKPDDNGDHEFLDDHEIRDIQTAKELAENNLLRLGIPFEEDYKFQNDKRKLKAKRNAKIRKFLDMESHIKWFDEEDDRRKNRRLEYELARQRKLEENGNEM